jgi:hypothetical protein
MKPFQVSVDPQGNAVVSNSTPISEHCKSRARLLATLVNTIAAPGGFEQFSVFPDTFKQEMLTLMQSIAEEQNANIAALEQHTAQSYYENGVRAAIEHRQQEDAPGRPKSNGSSQVPDFGQR